MDVYKAKKYIEKVEQAGTQLGRLDYFITRFNSKDIVLSFDDCNAWDTVSIPQEILPQIYLLIENYYRKVIKDSTIPITEFANKISIE